MVRIMNLHSMTAWALVSSLESQNSVKFACMVSLILLWEISGVVVALYKAVSEFPAMNSLPSIFAL